jgi:hypothetical protein
MIKKRHPSEPNALFPEDVLAILFEGSCVCLLAAAFNFVLCPLCVDSFSDLLLLGGV